MASEAAQKSQAILDKLVNEKKVPGAIACIVDRDGNTLFHGSAGVRELGKPDKMEKDDINWIASCTKLITAIACMQLVEQGKVKLDEPVGKILPELAKAEVFESISGNEIKTKAAGKVATLRQLLTHTGGHNYEFFNTDTKNYFEANGIKPFECTKASISAPLSRPPGEKWEYGTNIDWAGQIVERVSGMTLDQYFQKNIFQPIGVKHFSLMPEGAGLLPKLASLHQMDKDGNVKLRTGHVPSGKGHIMPLEDAKIQLQYGGAGGFANCAEYVQILACLLNGGKHPKSGARILSEESTKELLKPQITADHPAYEGLKTAIPDVMDDLTMPINFPLTPEQSWAFAGLISVGFPNGRSSTAPWWAGLCNQFWFADHENGLAGMIQTQLFPFNNPDVIGALFFEMEPLWQEVVKGKK